MLRRIPSFLPVVFASFLVLASCPERAGAQLPAGNDTSDATGSTGGGTNALSMNIGTDNTAYGFDALAKTSSGVDNTALGWEALLANTTGNDNTATGSAALQVNTTGNGNTGTGFAALEFNTTGSNNTATGLEALVNNDTGNDNTANGSSALLSNSTGNGNTACGTEALRSNTTGSDNAATGASALAGNNTGNSNTANGGSALEDNITGNANTASGARALGDNNTGSNNTALGALALAANTGGSDNIAIGASAGIKLKNGDNNIYIANKGAKEESDTIRIGKGHTATFIAGISGTPVSGSVVLIDRKGRLGIQASSARYKRDIETMGSRSGGLMKLRPVTFRYREDGEGLLQYGLIAEEVAAVYPELVVRGADGKVESVRYHELAPMLLNELQAQARTVSELTAQNETLRAALRSLEAREQERGLHDAAVMERIDRLEGQLGAARPAVASVR